jgi:hypothetical protein
MGTEARATRLPGEPPALPRALVFALLLLVLAVPFIRPVAILFADGPGPLSDFDLFYGSARAIVAGDAARLYDEAWFNAWQQRLFGGGIGGIWTYPPPYVALIAPLALVPRPLAMLLFTMGTLVAYLLVVRRLAGAWLGLTLLLLTPLLMSVVILGQNGLLTGTLTGLAVIGLTEQRRWAGVPLGLMIIKPHLAAGLAVNRLVARDGATVLTAALTVALAAAAATLALGSGIWPAFLAAVAHTSARLAGDGFPLYRMVSVYTAARTLGAAPAVATAAQGVMAVLALAAIVVAQRRLPLRQGLGIACLAGLMISPYAFDYDLPVAGIGLVLLLPALARHGRLAELLLAYAAFLLAACWGSTVNHGPGLSPLAAGGLAMPVLLALVSRILWRGRSDPAAPETQ